MCKGNTIQKKRPNRPARPTVGETRAARIERIMSGNLRQFIKPASQLRFSNEAARKANELAKSAISKEVTLGT